MKPRIVRRYGVVRVEGVASSAIGSEKALAAASKQSKQLVASFA
jgi:hypothetical protein